MIPYLFWGECDDWDEHFFHGDASVLEGAVVILNVIVVVVGICEEVTFPGENICGGDVGGGQSVAVRTFYLVYLFGIVVQVFANLVTEIGVGVLVTDDLDGVFDTDCAVVGGEDYFEPFRGYEAEQINDV